MAVSSLRARKSTTVHSDDGHLLDEGVFKHLDLKLKVGERDSRPDLVSHVFDVSDLSLSLSLL